jgi:hypothetical protein
VWFGTIDVPSKKTRNAALFTSAAIFVISPNIFLSQKGDNLLVGFGTKKMWPYSTGYAFRKRCPSEMRKHDADDN